MVTTARLAMLEVPGAPRTIYSTSLGNITGDISSCLWEIEHIDGEDLEPAVRDAKLDALFERLAESKEMLPAKLENCAVYLKIAQGEIDVLEAEIARLTARRDRISGRIGRFKSYMVSCLKQLQGCKVTTGLGEKMSIRQSVATEIYDDGLAWRATGRRAGFWKMQKPKPVAKAFKDALSNGEEIPGARLVEHENLSVRG